jgi:ferredoxin
MVETIFFVILGVLLVVPVGLWIFGERGRLLLPSTWKGLRAGGLGNFLNLNTIHMYVYARWTNQYVDVLLNDVFPRLGERGKKWWRDRYHAKILTPEQAEAIVVLDHDIPLQDLEQVIPYAMARNLILKGPPDVAAYECSCRHARANACQPTQVCMVVGQPFVDFILEHNPQSSRRLVQAEALDLLRAEHERGHVHSAWFKDALLDRFYVICNCCKCCCGGIEVMMKYGSPVLASSGYIAQVDETLCTACGICVDACPFGALSLAEVSAVGWDKCMGCGVCVGQCSLEAMTLVRDGRKGIPFDVRMLAQKEAA